MLRFLPPLRNPVAAAVSIVGFVSSFIGIAMAPPFMAQTHVLCGLGALTVGAIGYTVFRLRRGPPARVRGNLTQAQFDVCFAAGRRVYTTALNLNYIDRDQIDRWRARYDKGVFQAYDCKDRCLGYVSLWPIAEDAYLKLRGGELYEPDMDESMIATKDGAPFSYWYVADILRASGIKLNGSRGKFTTYLCYLMIFNALQQLLRERQLAFPVTFVAYAVSDGGADWLKRLQFECIAPETRPDVAHKGLFIKTFTQATLKSQLRELRDRIDDYEAKNRAKAGTGG